MTTLHCWADGPNVCPEHESPEHHCCDKSSGSTCMLPAGHEGEHEWTRDDGIVVAIKAGEA